MREIEKKVNALVKVINAAEVTQLSEALVAQLNVRGGALGNSLAAVAEVAVSLVADHDEGGEEDYLELLIELMRGYERVRLRQLLINRRAAAGRN